MKKGIEEYLADVKKALTPKMMIFIVIGVIAFIIHPLIGLIFAGVAINFLMSFYTSKGVLEREPSSEEERPVVNPDACETEDNPWNL